MVTQDISSIKEHFRIMEMVMEEVGIILRLSGILSSIFILSLFYLLLKYKNLYLGEVGKQKIKSHYTILKVAIFLGLFSFLMFVNCELMEALDLMGILPDYLEEAHHLTKVPQMAAMIFSQGIVLSVALKLKAEGE